MIFSIKTARISRSILLATLCFSGLGFVPDGHTVELDDLELTRDVSGRGDASSSVQALGRTRGAGLDQRLGLSDLPSDLQTYAGDASLIDSLYMVGPGDLFQIFVESSAIEKQVNSEGNIILNRIGVVHLEGLTLKQAKKLILDRLQTAYRRSDCFVNLSRPKMMRVSVTGAVRSPGVYDLPGNYRVTDAIKKAGGYSQQARRGMVKLRRGNDSTEVRLRTYFLNGDIDANPYLTQGTVVHIPFVDFSAPWVEVRRDSAVVFAQLESGESAMDLLMKSVGYRPTMVYKSMQVTEKDGSSSHIETQDASRYKPSSGAIIEAIPASQEVFVGGAVLRPGLQTYLPERMVAQYISHAGLITTSKVSKRILVIRQNGKREHLPLQSMALRPGDVLLVDQNAEQRFLLYTPILLSVVSLALVYIQVSSL